MKTLVVLQNAYSYDPLGERKIPFVVWLHAFLKCKTGKLFCYFFGERKSVFDKVSKQELHFINTTKSWGVGSKSKLKPDIEYVKNEIETFQPDFIISCGNQAKEVIQSLWIGSVLYIPHPASRNLTNSLLDEARKIINNMIVKDTIKVELIQHKGRFEIKSLL